MTAKMYQYQTDGEYTKDAQSYSWRKQQQIRDSAGNGKLMREGLATLILYRQPHHQLVIFTEKKDSLIEARVDAQTGFQMVRVINRREVVEVTDADAIGEMACYPALFELWLSACRRGLVG